MKLYGMNTIELLVFVLYRHFSRKYNFLQKCCQSNNGSKIFDMLRFITMKTSYKIFVDSREQKYHTIYINLVIIVIEGIKIIPNK